MIRYAKPEDANRIATINISAWQTAYRGLVSDELFDQLNVEKATKKVDERLKEQPHEIVVSENEKEIEGFIGFGAARDEDCDLLTAEIYTVYFDVNYYGNGHAHELFQFVLNEKIKSQGYREVILWVFEENKRARRFYEKEGFIKTNHRKVFNDQAPEIRLTFRVNSNEC